jgi:hypothetical protein
VGFDFCPLPTKPTFPVFARPAWVAIFACIIPIAAATPLTWAADGTPGLPTGGSGVWNLTSERWHDGSGMTTRPIIVKAHTENPRRR